MQKLQTFGDFERTQRALLDQMKKRDMDCISCPKCSSQWFEHVEVSRYKSDHNIILGQNVPPKPGTIPYVVLRCVNCKDILEPRILHNTRDVVGGDYDHFLDTLEGKHDDRKKEEVQENSNEIPSQKL